MGRLISNELMIRTQALRGRGTLIGGAEDLPNLGEFLNVWAQEAGRVNRMAAKLFSEEEIQAFLDKRPDRERDVDPKYEAIKECIRLYRDNMAGNVVYYFSTLKSDDGEILGVGTDEWSAKVESLDFDPGLVLNQIDWAQEDMRDYNAAYWKSLTAELPAVKRPVFKSDPAVVAKMQCLFGDAETGADVETENVSKLVDAIS